MSQLPFEIDLPVTVARTYFILFSVRIIFEQIRVDQVTFTGEVTNAENIKADMPKILKPTHFSGPKDNKANSFSALINIKADMKKVNNKAENWQKPDKY